MSSTPLKKLPSDEYSDKKTWKLCTEVNLISINVAAFVEPCVLTKIGDQKLFQLLMKT